MNEKLLMTRMQVQDSCELTQSTLYRLMGEDDFPRPIVLATQIRRWKTNEILDWIDRQKRAELGRPRKAASVIKPDAPPQTATG